MLRKYRILIVLLIAGLVQTACSSPMREASQVQGIPWWVWLLIIVVMAALFLWLWLTEPKRKATPPVQPRTVAPPAKPRTVAPPVQPKTAAPPAQPDAAAQTAPSRAAAPSQVIETPEGLARRVPPAPSEGEMPTPDDLKLIEGIGPKISGLLQEAGIMTFAHLAGTDVSRLKAIIAEAGLSALADPTTWPQQASLAATGQWDALEALQDALKGGRRV